MYIGKLNIALDIGNGAVKGKFEHKGEHIRFDYPSVVSELNSYTKVEGLNNKVSFFRQYEEMIASFDTPLVPGEKAMYVFGNKALNSGHIVDEFDIYSQTSKASQSLSYLLAMQAISASALHLAGMDNRTGQEFIVDVYATMAIPINDYNKSKDKYAEIFLNKTHRVIMKHYNKPVTIVLNFKEVKAFPEGIGAYIALKAIGFDGVNKLLEQSKRNGDVMIEGVTATDIINSSNIVCLDIGEGTVNMPVFTDGAFNAMISRTYPEGYGTVLSKAMRILNNEGFSFSSRKDLSTYIKTPETKINKMKLRRAKEVVQGEKELFVKGLERSFSEIANNIGDKLEVVMVYGGGANELKDVLYPMLIKNSKSDNMANYFVFYFAFAESRFLNREGLYEFAKFLKEKK